MHSIKPKTALISLSDKSGLEELVKFLVSKNVKMLSTGGTYKAIKEITSEVIEVSDFTGFEEMMDGRVKTLQCFNSSIHHFFKSSKIRDFNNFRCNFFYCFVGAASR